MSTAVTSGGGISAVAPVVDGVDLQSVVVVTPHAPIGRPATAAATLRDHTTSGRAGTRVQRPQSSRPTHRAPLVANVAVGASSSSPSGVGVPSQSSSTSRVAQRHLVGFEPTPSHLLRSRLHATAGAVLAPELMAQQSGASSSASSVAAIAAASRGLHEKMALLEEERRAVAELHRWEGEQNEAEIRRLMAEQASLRESAASRLSSQQAADRALAARKRRDLKTMGPMAIAGNMRAIATSGRVLNQDALGGRVAPPPAAVTHGIVARRPATARPRHTRPSTAAQRNGAHGAYGAGANVSALSSSPVDPVLPIPPSVALDPHALLHLRKACDSLRHTISVKQREHDAVARELEMMIVKVKSSAAGRQDRVLSDADGGASAAAAERAAAQRAFNPFLLTAHEQRTRLHQLLADHNEAVRDRHTLTQERDRLRAEHASFAPALRLLEHRVRARALEYEGSVHFYMHASTSAVSAESEKMVLDTRLEDGARQRAQQLRQRADHEHAHTRNRADTLSPRAGTRTSEEKTNGPTSDVLESEGVRLPSKTIVVAPLTPPARLLHATDPTPPDTEPCAFRTPPTYVHSPPRASTALVLAVSDSPIEASNGDACALTPTQQALCRAFQTLEHTYAQSAPPTAIEAATPPHTPSSLLSSALTLPSSDVDLNLVVAGVIEKMSTQARLCDIIEQKQSQIATIRDDQLAAARSELHQLQCQTQPTAACDDDTDKETDSRTHPEMESQQIQRIQDEVEKETSQIKLFTRKQAILDSLLSSARLAVRHLYDLTADDAPVLASDSSSSPARSAHSASIASRSSATTDDTSRRSQTTTTTMTTTTRTSASGVHQPKDVVATLAAFHVRLVDLAAGIPRAVLPADFGDLLSTPADITPVTDDSHVTSHGDCRASRKDDGEADAAEADRQGR